MLMAVVPSTPPVIAVTCTTDLSLFSLEGKRLSSVPRPLAPTVKCDENDIITQEVNRAVFDSANCAGRADDTSAVGAVVVGATGRVAEPHERDIRCVAASPEGHVVATG